MKRISPLTSHAKVRIAERTQLTEAEVLSMLDKKKFVDLGCKPGIHKQHLLIWSPRDEKAFVVVQDHLNGDILTVLPLDYHDNLAWEVTEEQVLQVSKLFASKPTHVPQAKVDPINWKTTWSIRVHYFNLSSGLCGAVDVMKVLKSAHASMEAALTNEEVIEKASNKILSKGVLKSEIIGLSAIDYGEDPPEETDIVSVK